MAMKVLQLIVERYCQLSGLVSLLNLQPEFAGQAGEERDQSMRDEISLSVEVEVGSG